jgi:hypothetical protein
MQQEDMLTAREATNAFRDAGLSETTFRRRIKDGKIEKHLPEGRTRGALYPKAQVLAAIGEAAKEKKPTRHSRPRSGLKPTTFRKATTQDMPGMAMLLETFYKAKISVPKRSAWIERNPECAYVLRCEDKVVGCGFIMPLAPQKIMTIFAQAVKPATLPEEILLFEPDEPLHLYVRSVGVLQSVSKEQRTYWAVKMIIGLANVVIGLGARGIVIGKLYAQGDTKAGEHALKLLGFTQITSDTYRKNFMMDVATSGSEVAVRYKRALNAWRTQYEEGTEQG